MSTITYKIKKVPIYFVLIGYLITTTANIFHFHKINFSIQNELIKSVNDNQANDNPLERSDFCIIHFAFNSLHNSIITTVNSNFDLIIYSEILNLSIFFSKIKKQDTSYPDLRAPPNLT